MRILYNGENYTKIKSLSFSPEVDILGNELAVNEFKAEIVTNNFISIGKYASLYSGDKIWAKYRITEAHRLSAASVTIKCQSDILILDRKTLPAFMCDNSSVKALIRECFTTFNLDCIIADDITDININGYLPEQTARQRLQWLCFVIGAYVQSFFSEKCTIKKVDETEKYIPPSKTFYRPKMSYKDYVTSVSATSYTYTEGTPGNTDEWVKVGNKVYIQTSQKASLNNSDVPADTPANVVDLSGITIINDSNISNILQRMAAEYFNREQLSADIINDGDIQPADKVSIYADKISIYSGVVNQVSGYVKSARFIFGKVAKSSIVLTQTTTKEAVKVILLYKYQNIEIGRETFTFPKNTDFELQNSYIDTTMQGLRRVYFPLKEKTTGNSGENGTKKNVKSDIALEFENTILSIMSVDSARKGTNGVVTIA